MEVVWISKRQLWNWGLKTQKERWAKWKLKRVDLKRPHSFTLVRHSIFNMVTLNVHFMISNRGNLWSRLGCYLDHESRKIVIWSKISPPIYTKCCVLAQGDRIHFCVVENMGSLISRTGHWLSNPHLSLFSSCFVSTEQLRLWVAPLLLLSFRHAIQRIDQHYLAIIF